MDDLNDAIKTLGRAQAGPQEVPGGNTPYVLVPEGYTAQALPELVYNEHALTPERVKQSVTVLDPESFINYYAMFFDNNSRVFADERTVSVVGILDYHQVAGGSPRRGSHRVTLELQKSEEWLRWTAANNKRFTQQEFAEFLEQNSMDITQPDPAAMLEVARDLQATTEVEFGSAIRQGDGQARFKYSETTKASVGAGQLEVPEQFTVTLPAFVGGARVAMQALLRFRLKEGHLTIFFTLVRPEEVLRTAFIAARDQIGTKLSTVVINGKP